MKKRNTIILVFLDIIATIIAMFVALLLRFDGVIPGFFTNLFLSNAIQMIIIRLIIFKIFGLYDIIWKYAIAEEYFGIIFGNILAYIITYIYFRIFGRGFPRSVFPIAFIIEVSLDVLSRVIPKVSLIKNEDSKNSDLERTLIVGAGEAGNLVLKEMLSHLELKYKPFGFIDDDKNKLNKKIQGVKVIGTMKDVKEIIEEKHISTVILAIPSLKSDERKYILDILSNQNVKVKIVPGYYQMVEGGTNRLLIRDVEIGDLLGRETVTLDEDILRSFIEDSTILVTGGGGSIGSELSRQIAGYKPKKLILLDIYENGVYDVQMELTRNYPDLDLIVLIGSIVDKQRMDYIFNKYKPEVVFHAAAHKHVPLMEFSPQSAIKNNVFGTYNVAKAASENGVKKFVLISTDKAVNPTSVMGTTKTICERTIRYWDERSVTNYSAVRFGNVLGSSGSVIPLFKNQIASGGPVTVTSEHMIRYFMTIPEACQLVLTSGAIAKGGETFILDMGEPVKIIDLAEKLVSLSGYKPYRDIDIKIVGLRPGEKMDEERT